MPTTIGLMSRELKVIAWQQELNDRRTAEAEHKKRRKGKRGKDDDKPIVFDETPEAALHSLAVDILAAYKDRDRGVDKSVSYVREVIPKWMTWPMLNEWAQRFMMQYNFQLKLAEIQKRIAELEKKEAELLAQSVDGEKIDEATSQ
jgi:hypothetical protein